MVFENVNFENLTKIHVPAAKKRKIESSTWGTSEMPSIPVLVNKAKILKHVQLVVFQQEKKKDNK